MNQSTTKYVAFLRGINVSGQKIIKMEVLRELFALPGINNITSYIQSGNVLFETNDTDEHLLCNKIEEQLYNKLGYRVIVILRTLHQLECVLKNNPYQNLEVEDKRKVSISFLKEKPINPHIALPANISIEMDEFCILDSEVYLLYQSYGSTKLSNTFFEKKLAQPATTRNLNTVCKVIELLKKYN